MLRTVAEQDALYAKGALSLVASLQMQKGAHTAHRISGAWLSTFTRMTGWAYNESGQFFMKVGQVAKSLGLGWGGDWISIVDKPHVDLPDWESTKRQLK